MLTHQTMIYGQRERDQLHINIHNLEVRQKITTVSYPWTFTILHIALVPSCSQVPWCTEPHLFRAYGNLSLPPARLQDPPSMSQSSALTSNSSHKPALPVKPPQDWARDPRALCLLPIDTEPNYLLLICSAIAESGRSLDRRACRLGGVMRQWEHRLDTGDTAYTT